MEEKYASGHTARRVTGEEGEYLEKNYFAFSDGANKFDREGFLLPVTFTKNQSQHLWNLEVQPTDISIATFPKSGTTWMEEIVWSLVHNPNQDNPDSNISIDTRIPDFEADMYLNLRGLPEYTLDEEEMQLLRKHFPNKPNKDIFRLLLASILPAPRMFKIHKPLCFVTPNLLDIGKVVYVARDPRDVVVSYYHFSRIHICHIYDGTLDAFVEDFVNDRNVHMPYWSHVKLAWEKRNHPNMCFVYYEDLQEDLFSQVKRIDKFLGINRSDEQLRNVTEFCGFSSMKERTKDDPPTSFHCNYFRFDVVEKEGGFFRKGKSGNWKDELTPSQKEKMNSWMAKNLSQFGEDFKYKI